MRDLFRQYFTKGFGFGAGLVTMLLTAGLLAVAVSTLTTFTTGTPAKASEVNANFAAIKTAIEGIPSEKAMRLIYETDITTAVSTLSITGLNGDSDIEYVIKARFVNQGASTTDYWMSANGDTTTNYGYRAFYATNAGAVTNDSNDISGAFLIGSQTVSGGLCFTVTELYAKSGYRRIAQNKFSSYGSTTAYMNSSGFSYWNNTGSNLTTLTITGTTTNVIGSGSHIEVWARK
jgi:hypothetical protein